MPVSRGRCLRSAENASSPPADAPIPTIGNGPAARGPARALVSPCLVTDGAVRGPARVFFIGFSTAVSASVLPTRRLRSNQTTSIVLAARREHCFARMQGSTQTSLLSRVERRYVTSPVQNRTAAFRAFTEDARLRVARS